MSTQHTPGPWTNHGRIPQPGLPHSAVAAKTLIARVYSEAFGDEAQEKANADLIAAAPDMYEALKNIDARLRECTAIGLGLTAADVYDSFYREIVRAALAKAEGKS